jgi:hypothetical protein
MKYATFWLKDGKLIRIVDEGLESAYSISDVPKSELVQHSHDTKFHWTRTRLLSEVHYLPKQLGFEKFVEYVESFNMEVGDNIYVEADGRSILAILRYL